MLKTVKLYGDLKEITGHSELDANVSNVGDAIRFLLMNWPQLEAHMNKQEYQVLTDGTDIGEEEIHYPVSEEIKIVPVIRGAGGNTGKIIAGVILIGIAIAAPGAGLWLKGSLGFGAYGGSAIYAAAGNIGIALLLSGVAGLLFPMPKDKEDDQDPRISFDFGGTSNTARAGSTHPVVYGEIFTGSTVISMNLTTDQVSA
tara:strand:- start:934 stop:1533 length:600 start_codon:yes stop_codon:yes gene_type:complete